MKIRDIHPLPRLAQPSRFLFPIDTMKWLLLPLLSPHFC